MQLCFWIFIGTVAIGLIGLRVRQEMVEGTAVLVRDTCRSVYAVPDGVCCTIVAFYHTSGTIKPDSFTDLIRQMMLHGW